MRYFLNLGAGVQSSVMALMFEHGEINEPKPEAAIFADTGAEPAYVYEWLDWLEGELSYPVHRVQKGNLRDDIMASIDGGRFAGAPFFTETRGGKMTDGRLRRQCTREYKITPITRELRRLLGLKKGQRAGSDVLAVQYIGISYDEAIRMKRPKEKWLEHRWPLVDMNMRRLDCLRWMEARGFPLPKKSSCTFCPYHDNAYWRWQQQHDPESFADAVRMDEAIRGGVRGTKEKLFLHRSLKPLAEIDFSQPKDFGQEEMFADECEGMCGV